MKKLYSLLGNSQKLDGGSMFGNAPKAMWQKWVEVDDLNRIDLACRALLIQESQDGSDKVRNVLLEVGVGAFFEPKLKQRFGIVESHHVLLDSLSKIGLSHKDIDVIVLSHLHFDHAGGLLTEWREGEQPELLFPNATLVIGKESWQRAFNPHARDRASFLPQLGELLESRGNIELIDVNKSQVLGADYSFHYSHGHTPGMMLTEVSMPAGPIVFCADLIPGKAWVHLPITMGYDRFAELVIDEKKSFLADMLERKGRLFYTHDADSALSSLNMNERKQYVAENSMAELVGLIE